MDNQTRRDFIKVTAFGLAGAASTTIASSANPINHRKSYPEVPFELGIASYTFRHFSLEDTLKMSQRVAIKHITLKSMHLPLDSTKEEIQIAVQKIKESGINLYGCGVVYMENEEQVNQAFNYAQAAGMKIIIGVPGHELLPLVEKKVKEYDIKLAIHNHGPGDERYPSPESAYEKIRNMDPRMGLCIDIGHTQRIGINPSESAEKYFDRLHDIHIKDESEASPEGKTVEIGRGVIDVPEFLRTLIKLGYNGKVSFEFEKDEEDPLPGLAESIGYVRGVLDMI